ncbi:hypothetical protein NDU88_001140 [Pleurodeles waltl]|uniref:Uncharacterized protein n=1 Tax=Pleurodeles waltl TaxID=8319 RepID=A0AAV7L8M6_PLEWA|nr:hypothetical protein NDU88_001140 [Pleurodeles waltl]
MMWPRSSERGRLQPGASSWFPDSAAGNGHSPGRCLCRQGSQTHLPPPVIATFLGVAGPYKAPPMHTRPSCRERPEVLLGQEARLQKAPRGLHTPDRTPGVLRGVFRRRRPVTVPLSENTSLG